MCEYIYAGVCVYICMYIYGWVCTCMYVDTCKYMWGALSPPAVWPQGVLFLWEWEHRIWLIHCVTLRVGWSPTSSWLWQGISYSSLSVCYCCVPSTSGTLMHPNLAHLLLTINQQKGHESNNLAFCSSLTTSTLVPNPITTDSYFLTLNGPTSNTYAKVT